MLIVYGRYRGIARFSVVRFCGSRQQLSCVVGLEKWKPFPLSLQGICRWQAD
jgi:hypothetical protein